MIIDFHTHAFPDKIADNAMAALTSEVDVKAYLDGRLSSLVDSMDAAGIDASVLANIATKPEQFENILTWSKKIRSERIVPFCSIHPNDTQALEHIRVIKEEGFKGIKLHPYYQSFTLNEERMLPLYEAMAKHDLILLSHTGFDMAFPFERICDPEKIINLTHRFPELIFVASHLGAWEDWDEVETHILGKKIYIEISYSLHMLPPERARSLIEKHPKEYILFGTDSPWMDQSLAIADVEKLSLDSEYKDALLGGNAERLLFSCEK